MNSILAEIYSTILPSAPFLIAAYALVWASLFVFLFAQYRKVTGVERRLTLLEEAAEDKAQAEN